VNSKSIWRRKHLKSWPFIVQLLCLGAAVVSATGYTTEATTQATTEATTQAAAEATITWAINPGPPFHILSGPLAGQGFCDGLVDSLTILMPNYQHKKVVVPQGRVLALLGATDSQMCFPCMIKRQDPPKGVRFTESTHQFPRHVLITRASLMHSSKPLELSTLLASAKYRYGYPQGRRYGALDPLLEAYKTEYPDLVLARSGPGEADSILSLIEIGRIDFTVDYPMVLKYHQLVSQTDGSVPLKMLPILENADNHPQHAVGCADNSWGLQVVTNINQVIPALHQSPRFRQAKQFWLDEQQAKLLKAKATQP
jgi:uncharacterized protein (TIGR02285 family)